MQAQANKQNPIRDCRNSVPDKENDMEDELRPVNVIRADLARAKDQLAALGPDTGDSVHGLARHRCMSLAEELRAAEEAAECLAETVALKWIHRYASGKRVTIDPVIGAG
jgi:hypothetical protein